MGLRWFVDRPACLEILKASTILRKAPKVVFFYERLRLNAVGTNSPLGKDIHFAIDPYCERPLLKVVFCFSSCVFSSRVFAGCGLYLE